MPTTVLTQTYLLFWLGNITIDLLDSLRLPRSLRLFWYASFRYLRFLYNILVGILFSSLTFIRLGDSVEFISTYSKRFFFVHYWEVRLLLLHLGSKWFLLDWWPSKVLGEFCLQRYYLLLLPVWSLARWRLGFDNRSIRQSRALLRPVRGSY
jgi:hypothetical protein